MTDAPIGIFDSGVGGLTVARAIIDLAHDLDFWVVAEGVEDPAQFEWLRDVKCDQYQGYLFSPALPPEDFAAALAKRE